MKHFRQGDVFIKVLEKAEGDFQSVKSYVVAYGEVTNHRHLLTPLEKSDVKVFVDGVKLIVDISGLGAKLVHEEHETITFNPGLYEFTIQRQYDPVTYQKRVAD